VKDGFWARSPVITTALPGVVVQWTGSRRVLVSADASHQMVAGRPRASNVGRSGDKEALVADQGQIRTETRGAVRLLWLDAPPANMLSAGLRQQLWIALNAGMASAQVAAIVLIGQGRGFSNGCDLAELGAQASPTVGDLVRIIQAAQKPVIVALHGGTYGVAAELALAARGRVALGDLRVGLRDVLSGYLPSAGATQTLPRLVGGAAALRLIGQAVVLTGAEALAMGVIDQLVPGDLAAAGVAMALAPPAPDRSPGLRDGRAYLAAVKAARAAGGGLLAGKLIDCVEAAQLLPLAQGLDFEAEAAAEVAATPEAATLRHAMLTEMRMAADAAGGRSVDHIGFWGAGMLPLIWPALHRGLSVTVADDDREALVNALEKVALAQEAEVQAGRLDRAVRDAEWARLTPGVDARALAGLGLILAAKPGVAGPVVQFGAGEGQEPRLLLVAPAVAELQLRPQDRALGLTAAATLRRMGLRLAVTGPVPQTGVVRALLRAARMALLALAAQGVSAPDLAAGLKGWLKLPLPEATGQGRMARAEVTQRVLAALAAEGARLLGAGVVQRAGDIDALAVMALGVPRSFGGPMFRADQRGLMLLRRDLMIWQADHPVWAVHPIIDQLLSDGRGFDDFMP
jgi:3-hydroxyacyl-CoA dehydrogenase